MIGVEVRNMSTLRFIVTRRERDILRQLEVPGAGMGDAHISELASLRTRGFISGTRLTDKALLVLLADKLQTSRYSVEVRP